ncbi:hypothetical protein MMC07_006016 [Pseudocyphellaria aurata]|nr:hypothetical protein [Pseudocyphellaria aurata]
MRRSLGDEVNDSMKEMSKNVQPVRPFCQKPCTVPEATDLSEKRDRLLKLAEQFQSFLDLLDVIERNMENLDVLRDRIESSDSQKDNPEDQLEAILDQTQILRDLVKSLTPIPSLIIEKKPSKRPE